MRWLVSACLVCVLMESSQSDQRNLPSAAKATEVAVYSIAPYMRFDKEYATSIKTTTKSSKWVISSITEQTKAEVASVYVSTSKDSHQVTISAREAPAVEQAQQMAVILHALIGEMEIPENGQLAFMCSISRIPKSKLPEKEGEKRPAFQASISWLPAKPGAHFLAEFDESGKLMSVTGGA